MRSLSLGLSLSLVYAHTHARANAQSELRDDRIQQTVINTALGHSATGVPRDDVLEHMSLEKDLSQQLDLLRDITPESTLFTDTVDAPIPSFVKRRAEDTVEDMGADDDKVDDEISTVGMMIQNNNDKMTFPFGDQVIRDVATVAAVAALIAFFPDNF